MLSSILIGALSGQRALSPIAAVAITAAQDRLPEGNEPVPLLDNKLVAGGLLAVAVAEMVGDKWPKSPNRTVLCAGAGGFEAAHVTLTQGVFIGIEDDAPERLAARLDEVVERAGETVPQSGAAQGTVEVGKAMAAASRR